MNRLPVSHLALHDESPQAALIPAAEPSRVHPATPRDPRAGFPAMIAADLSQVPPGLSVNALKSLFYIYRGQRSMTQLSKKLHVTRAAMTGVVDAMEKQGIALRCAHPDDRRRTLVNLTKEGERLAASIFPVT